MWPNAAEGPSNFKGLDPSCDGPSCSFSRDTKRNQLWVHLTIRTDHFVSLHVFNFVAKNYCIFIGHWCLVKCIIFVTSEIDGQRVWLCISLVKNHSIKLLAFSDQLGFFSYTLKTTRPTKWPVWIMNWDCDKSHFVSYGELYKRPSHERILGLW